MAKGVSDVHRAAKFAANPIDGFMDIAIDAGTDLLTKHMLRKGSGRLAPIGELSSKNYDPECSTDYGHECLRVAAQNGDVSASIATASAVQNECEGLELGWERVHESIFGPAGVMRRSGSIMAKSQSCQDDIRLRSGSALGSGNTENAEKDVFCGWPVSVGGVNPAHKAAISMVISMMIGGMTSGAMPALASHGLEPFMHQGNDTVLEQKASIRSATSIQTASSFMGGITDKQSLLGVGGMAASTAFKLLRAGALHE